MDTRACAICGTSLHRVYLHPTERGLVCGLCYALSDAELTRLLDELPAPDDYETEEPA
jgi:recombinational DNA repair protein (RecF pathway)